MGLNVLDKIRPHFQALWPAVEQAAQAVFPAEKPAPLPPDDPQARAGDSHPAEPPDTPAEVDLPSLQALLEQLGSLSPHSAIIGLCEDGLPFVLDLYNPAPGSLLIAGDPNSGKTRLLQAILTSAALLNSPAQVSFRVLAYQREEYLALAKTEHCQKLHAIDEHLPGEMIDELATIVEERRASKPGGPALILAIDDLGACLQYLDKHTYHRLYWLIRHGPRSRVWVMATLSSRRVKEINPRYLTAFRSRLAGLLTDQKLAASLLGKSNGETRRLHQGYQFWVPYSGEGVRFWVCEPETEDQA
ncbi:MAG: hypothetical protein JXB15_08075 [Anaerolineales bacterium]|nr:hypothetical protein [Anaerolineales bacterium]